MAKKLAVPQRGQEALHDLAQSLRKAMTLPGDHNSRQGSYFFNMTFHIIVQDKNLSNLVTSNSLLYIQPRGLTHICAPNQGVWEPRFQVSAQILSRTMEKSVRIFLHSCKIKSGQRPGNEARGMTHPVLPTKGCEHLCTHVQPFPYCCKLGA